MLADEYNKASARKDYKGKTDEELHDIAYSEVVAQCCETLLSDTDAVSRLASQIKAENKTLWNKICEFFRNLAEALKNAYEGLAPGSEIANQAKDTIQNVERLRDLWASAGAGAIKNYTSSSKVGNDGNGNAQRMEASENLRDAEGQKNTTHEGGVMLMSREDIKRIKEQIIAVLDQLNKMDVVSSVKTVGFSGMKKSDIAKAVEKEYAKFGKRIDRENFGIILLEYPQINKALEYLNTDGEKSALLTVPRVLKRGIIADMHTAHKERGVDSVTFAAPVEINGTRGNVGVVVQRVSGTNRFKTLRILLPNGKAFEFVQNKEADSTSGSSSKHRGSEGIPIESASKNSIRSDDGIVNKKLTERKYSYDSLVSKPDMEVTTVSGNVPKNRADVVYQAKQNAAKIGKFNTKDGSVSVHVKDIDADVILGTYGLKHSLDRRMEVNAPVTMMAGKIIRNSIKINELTPEKSEADESYVLIGAARNDSGELYVVRSVLNKFSNELSSMDVLYAINAKKGNRLRSMRPGFQGPVTDSTISISELLDYVNEYFPDILPEDVLKHYGHDARPDGKLGESALYSDRNDGGMSNRQLLVNALESSVQHEVEAKRLAEYKENIRKVSELQMQLGDLNNQIKELSFAKGIKDTKKIRELRDDKIKAENRINVIDGALLRLESMQAIKNVLERERERIRKYAVRNGKAALDAYRKSSEKKQSEIIDQPAAEEKPQRAFFIDYPRKVLVTSRRIGSTREKILMIQGYTVLRDRNTITRQKAVTPRGHSTARFRDTI